jgi:hypothetical protein
MTIDTVRSYPDEGLVAVAVSDANAPLVYVHDEPEQRFALFAFSVTDAKLMFAPGFPSLMSSTIGWLAHPIAGGTRRPGAATFEGHVATLVGPDAKPIPVTNIGAVSVTSLVRPGFYEAKSGGATSVIAVSAGDPEVSDVGHTRLPAEAANANGAGSRGRPWWLIAAALALILLAVEWWTWQRRVTV